MPVLDIDPGQSPEAPGTLRFYKQGAGEDSGFVATTEGAVTIQDTTIEGALTVDGYLATESGQSDGVWNVWSGEENALNLGTAGGGIAVKEGTNARMGVSTLVAGAAVVANTSVTANTRVFLTGQSPGGTPGFVRVSARTPATSFTITSSSGTDTSVVAWLLIEPAT